MYAIEGHIYPLSNKDVYPSLLLARQLERESLVTDNTATGRRSASIVQDDEPQGQVLVRFQLYL